MPVRLYMDVHVPIAITEQLRSRGVDVLTAQEDGSASLEDAELLTRATELNRLLFTQDIRFEALARQWQRNSLPFAGVLFGHQLGGTIGQFVLDLHLIAVASELTEWLNVVERIPYRRTTKHDG